MQYTAIFHGCKNGSFSDEKKNVFLILLKTYRFGALGRRRAKWTRFGLKKMNKILTIKRPNGVTRISTLKMAAGYVSHQPNRKVVSRFLTG